EAGMARYVVSNWSRLAFECRYNLTVWAQGGYEAYGLGGHGGREGGRTRTLRPLDTYPAPVVSGERPGAGTQTLAGCAGESARPGFACRSNLTVWAQGEYEDYGLGAHGLRDGVRTRNLGHLDTYLETVESGKRPLAGTETLSEWDAELDRLFVGLGRAVGVAHG